MELAGWPHLKKLEDEMTEQTIDELIDELVQQTLNCVEGPVAANGCAISTVLWAAIISIVIGFVKLMGG